MADTQAQNLDGKTPIKPTPFDAHEQATRGQHVETGPESPDKSDVQEYPKAVDHVDHPSGQGKEPVVVNSADEEAAYHESKAEGEVELEVEVEKQSGKAAEVNGFSAPTGAGTSAE